MEDFLFKPILLEDRGILEAHFERYPQTLSGYRFGVLFPWAPVYDLRWTFIEPELLLLSAGTDYLLQPVGPFSPEAQRRLLEKPHLRLQNVSQEFIDQYPEFCSHFTIRERRDNANYIYNASDLAELKGGKYERKRNLIAQAERLYRWKAVPLWKELVPLCDGILLKMERPDPKESIALKRALEYFEDLELDGVLLKVDDLPVAFSIYEKQNPETAVVHFEKANKQYKGSYQMINRATARRIQEKGYTWINREEDMGIAGIRKAKLSYAPVFLEASYILAKDLKDTKDPN